MAARTGQDQGRNGAFYRGNCGDVRIDPDLGDPPFGHAGEDAMRQWFDVKFGNKLQKELKNPQLTNDFMKFDGNAQSLRLIGTLQILADYHGLNLPRHALSELQVRRSVASGQRDIQEPSKTQTRLFCFGE